MRTTLNLDDDILELATRRARSRGVSLGRAVSELARRGLEEATPFAESGGVVAFRLPPGSPKVTAEDVHRVENGGNERSSARHKHARGALLAEP